MTIGSLFSGIGGIELGLEACGLGPTIWQAESDPYARAVLAKHWPEVKRYEDVRDIDASAERPDIICGGFPCQDISNAGKREGIGGGRSGLWSEFARIVRVVRPRLVFVENVAALLGRGMGVVLGDLAALGFDAEWGVFRASDVGAPHQRERVFILANADGMAWTPTVERDLPPHAAAPEIEPGTVGRGRFTRRGGWNFEPSVGRVVAGFSGGMDDRLRCLGNAVVPAQAALAFRELSGRVHAQRAA